MEMTPALDDFNFFPAHRPNEASIGSTRFISFLTPGRGSSGESFVGHVEKPWKLLNRKHVLGNPLTSNQTMIYSLWRNIFVALLLLNEASALMRITSFRSLPTRGFLFLLPSKAESARMRMIRQSQDNDLNFCAGNSNTFLDPENHHSNWKQLIIMP